MDEMEQLEVIWYQSTKLAEREEGEFLFVLYQVDSFYIEEKIHKEDNVRLAFKSFSSTNAEIFQPYLEKIDIGFLKQ